ncbi:basic salivary proline-rich protein 2-like [Balaenoptera ricei]|uniref:basic salivary proline-rich protein 2-like n=1 Tax=Balaenoptera ricei TaxID=2746895 RepID=UPI0028BD68C5|nr:basic salivary proline-rich protein 2-like [Balaenoptera ricei]
MVSGRHRTTLRRARRLRRSFVHPQPPTSARRPCPSPPRPQTPPSAEPLGRTRRAPGAPGITAAPAPGGGRAGVLYVTDSSGKRKGAEGSWRRQPLPPPPRGDAVPRATRKHEMGGKSAADAYGTRTVPERQQAALPRFARRAPATSPGCAARSPPCGGGWAAAGPPPLPRSPHPREAGSPPGTPGRFPQRRHRLRRRNQKPRHSPEVPRPPAPQHPSGKSRAPLQEARIKQTKTP